MHEHGQKTRPTQALKPLLSPGLACTITHTLLLQKWRSASVPPTTSYYLHVGLDLSYTNRHETSSPYFLHQLARVTKTSIDRVGRPPEGTYRSMGKASTVSSWLCCPCRCLFCGLLSCIFSVVATILVIAGVVVLALYLLFRPHLIQATVASADLADFTLTPQTWILRYNLSVALSVRNPNSRIAIHYKSVVAEAYYQGQSFARADIPDFYQDTGETTVVPVAFAGDHPLQGGVAAAGFRKEAIDHASFSVDIKFSAKMKLKVWAFRVPGPKPKVDCPLIVQRRNASEPAGDGPRKFHPIDCRVWF